MTRVARLVSVAAVVVGIAAGPGIAAPALQPTVERCLRAWNSAPNDANRRRVAALGSLSASLQPGVAGVDTWSKNGVTTSTSSPACLLTLTQHGTMRLLTGVWSGSRISAWRFGRPVPTHGVAPPANVRVRPGARLSLR